MTKKPKDGPSPGWYFIEKYVPDASPGERADAYERLRELVKICVELDDRLTREHEEKRQKLQPELFDLEAPP